MRILIDFTSIPLQKVGVGVYAKETFKNITDFDSRNRYYVIIQDNDIEFRQIFTNINCKVILVNASIFRKLFFRFILEQIYIPILCLIYNIDIVHCLHYSFPLLTFNKVKKVVTIHDLTFFIYPRLHTFVKRHYFRIFIKLSCKYADQLICVSNSTKNDLGKYVKNICAKIDVVPLAADVPQMIDNKFIIEKLNLKQHYILFIGTLEPRKNIVRLLEAYNRIKYKEQFKLVIIGKKGWYYDEIFNKVKELQLDNNVVFTGFINTQEKYLLLSKAYIFIYPSLYEGFGLPVLEALKLGIPTITSNISSMPEVAGQSSILINPYNVEEMTTAIDFLIENKEFYKELSKESLEQAKKFTWEITSNMTISIYNKLK